MGADFLRDMGPSGPRLKGGQNALSQLFFLPEKNGSTHTQLSNYCVQTFSSTVTLSLRGIQFPDRSSDFHYLFMLLMKLHALARMVPVTEPMAIS